ncbi:unnamed protein product [Boreogadus saida]
MNYDMEEKGIVSRLSPTAEGPLPRRCTLQEAVVPKRCPLAVARCPLSAAEVVVPRQRGSGGRQPRSTIAGNNPFLLHEMNLYGRKFAHFTEEGKINPPRQCPACLQDCTKKETFKLHSEGIDADALSGEKLTSSLGGRSVPRTRGRVHPEEIDFRNESIKLSSTAPTELKDLPSRIPKEAARYHFFLYRHNHDGSYLESPVFIYSMPGYKCSIRDRMLYSSCKNNLLEMVENNLQIHIAKKMEIDNGDDLTAEYLYEEVHPRQHAHQQTFAKPHGPSGKKGGRRITRPPGHRDQDD